MGRRPAFVAVWQKGAIGTAEVVELPNIGEALRACHGFAGDAVMGAGRYVGRVGALAVALGVGFGVSSGVVVAQADSSGDPANVSGGTGTAPRTGWGGRQPPACSPGRSLGAGGPPRRSEISAGRGGGTGHRREPPAPRNPRRGRRRGRSLSLRHSSQSGTSRCRSPGGGPRAAVATGGPPVGSSSLATPAVASVRTTFGSLPVSATEATPGCRFR